MSILETIEQRQKEAKQVKQSGVIDRIQGKQKKDDELAEIEGYSENVAWSYKDQREQAEEKFQSLSNDAGYKIDYSVMTN